MACPPPTITTTDTGRGIRSVVHCGGGGGGVVVDHTGVRYVVISENWSKESQEGIHVQC